MIEASTAQPKWHVGDVVRKLRRAKGWDQGQLAKRAHVHKNTIVRLEENSEGIKSLTLEHIATALGTSVGRLYDLVPNPGKETPRESDGNPLPTAGHRFRRSAK